MIQKQFICAGEDYCSFEKHVSAPYLRRNFQVNFQPKQAKLQICGLGFYRLFINGEELTKGLIAPYVSNLDHICYYDEYDVTSKLQLGENVIGVLLGNGMMNAFGGAIWEFDTAPWRGAPRLALYFCAEGEGKKLQFEADEKFRIHSSPILFDDLRMGEIYNATNEISGWNCPGYDDSDWEYAIRAKAPKGELRFCDVEPVIVKNKLRPKSITRCGDDYLYDFGENNAGLTKLSITAEPGQQITLWHAEILREGKFFIDNIIFDRPGFEYYKTYNQKTVYIAKGGKTETHIPSFTYYGFRYVLVQGITEKQATEDLLTYLVMHSDIKEIGGFNCSDDTVNTLFEMVRRSDLSNFYYFPTDCPHREKNGWTGDASLSSDHMILLYDVERSWREWLVNIRKCQTENGALPGIVPTSGWGYDGWNGPIWDSVLFNLPYMLYRFRGNLDVIKENANAMLMYLDYVYRNRNSDGLVEMGLGDWVPVGKKKANDYDAPLNLTTSIAFMDLASKAKDMFRAIGYIPQAEFSERIQTEMRKNIREKLMDPITFEMCGKCQSSQALALYYGVFNDEEKQQAFSCLMKYIHQNADNFDCGFFGIHVLFNVLFDFGESDLAYRMITKKEYPSYGHMIECGETTLTERFLQKGELIASRNHHFFGDIGRLFMTRIAGLTVVDANTLCVRPTFIRGMNYAEAYCELPSGKVSLRWDRYGDSYVLQLICPLQIEFSIQLPEDTNVSVKIRKV